MKTIDDLLEHAKYYEETINPITSLTNDVEQWQKEIKKAAVHWDSSLVFAGGRGSGKSFSMIEEMKEQMKYTITMHRLETEIKKEKFKNGNKKISNNY